MTRSKTLACRARRGLLALAVLASTGVAHAQTTDPPLRLTSWGQLMLVTHPKTGFRTASDLVEAARRAPGKLNYASPGVGTPHHLSMELEVKKAFSSQGIDPSTGTPEAFGQLVQKDAERWVQLIKAQDIKAE